jgi:KDO2-lipid IV(A) lauroyltransferase
MGRAVGAVAWHLRIRRRVVLENLALAFPDKTPRDRSQLGRAVYRALGTSLGETLLAPWLSDPEIVGWLDFDGFGKFDEAVSAGRGVVVAIGHFGNWELLGRGCARRGIRMALIGRKLKGLINRKLIASRAQSGMGQLPDRGATSEALRRLRAGEALAIAIDQNMRPKRGIFVDFFGHPACTTPAAAVYALRAGAPILAAFPVRQPDGRHRIVIEGPFDAPDLSGSKKVEAITQQLTRAMEAMVRAHPDQWFWLHRRWKTKPGDR